eukprot:TRINITY_DN875_c0_g1_i2.p1 TRINITY_DN875_c0_g1~~TRINITY_DN875_c0_g1_i2.p1  ORF type:complete len:217 (+),score=31.94 TRINITY_DN875_c0_g1_i2:107-757(+)
MDTPDQFDYLLKLVLIGNSGAGKTCLLMKFADNTFTETYTSTIGVDFRVKVLTLFGKRVKLQIWDTAGQERFRTICSSYYRGANGIIMVYDVTDQNSFNNIPAGWAPEVEKNAPDHVAKLIVGTKIDLGEHRVVPTEQGASMATSVNAVFIETSAKDGSGVEEAFEQVAKEAMKKMGLLDDKGNSNTQPTDTETKIVLGTDAGAKKPAAAASKCCK